MDTYQFTTTMNVPAEAVDLYEWLTNVSDTEYQSFAKAHRAMGLFKEGDQEGIINVEDVAGNLLIQHYLIVHKSKEALHMHSEKSDIYLSHLLHAHIGVDWKMSVRPVTANSVTFLCEVSTILPNKLFEAASTIGFAGHFLQQHVDEEGQNFAQDIERKTRQKMVAG